MGIIKEEIKKRDYDYGDSFLTFKRKIKTTLISLLVVTYININFSE